MNEVFGFVKKPYCLQTNLHLRSKRNRTTKYDIEARSYLQMHIKSIQNYHIACGFMANVKTSFLKNCPCVLYKNNIHQIELLDRKS